MKRLKKILILCLVVAMCASLTIPAFAISESQATAYVSQLYSGLLGRALDDSGRYMYVNKIMNEGWNSAAVAENIAESAEFRDRQLSNVQYVQALYLGLLGRDADENGLNAYVSQLDTGTSRSSVMKQILSSLEFTKVSANFDLQVGSIAESQNVDVSQTSVNSSLASEYVTRLYRVLLDREPDADGLAHWTEKLTKREMSASGVAASIAASDEFNARSLSNGDYVQALYLALLNRNVDGYGWTTYMTALANGRSRSWVFASICASAEFRNLFGEVNVVPGTVSPSSYPIGGNTVNETAAGEFVDRVYLNMLGRYPDAEGRNNYVQILLNRQMSAAGVAAQIASSGEARNRDLTRSDFVNNVYWALLGRSVDAAGLKTYTDALANGYSRSWVFTKICASPEFQGSEEFNTMNVVPGYLNSADYNMGG